MPLFKTRSAAVYGIDAHPVDVEVDLYRSGMARDFMLVGMPDTAVRESRERIKSALMNSGFGYPNQAVTVNLRAPLLAPYYWPPLPSPVRRPARRSHRTACRRTGSGRDQVELKGTRPRRGAGIGDTVVHRDLPVPRGCGWRT